MAGEANDLLKQLGSAMSKATKLLDKIQAAEERGRSTKALESQYAEAWTTASDLKEELTEVIESEWSEFAQEHSDFWEQ